MSNVDEHSYSTLPDNVVDHTVCAIRKAHAMRFETTEIPHVAPDEEKLVQKWREWGFTWRDVAENLKIHRAGVTKEV